ncbi:ankyrin repeat-containing domain protein, partial [Rhexocercosporidium sp. MPI-PUGE-AT-0058]
MKMDLFNFTEHILHKILLYSIISRGMPRALRLKLICKRFKSLFQPALFESRVLDDFIAERRISCVLEFMENWYIRRTYGAQKLWHSYLLYRVKNERDSKCGRFVEIRQLAENLCPLTDLDYEPTLDALCWLALGRGSYAPGHREAWGSQDPNEMRSNPGLNLLSAAAYFNQINLAKTLLLDGYCPTLENYLFPSPIQLAAWAGNADILMLFQERRLNWRAKSGPGSIKGAVMLGDMDMIRLAIYPPSRSANNITDFAGQRYGYVEAISSAGYDLQNAIFCARTWEVFQYIDSFFRKPFLSSPDALAIFLAHQVDLGNIDMVRRLLNEGADVDGGGRRHNCNPLIIAARYGHEDIVDLLLERGANPNHSRGQASGCALMAAASGGSLNIVKKLLDHGASLERAYWDPLRPAIKLEHTAMVKLIM